MFDENEIEETVFGSPKAKGSLSISHALDSISSITSDLISKDSDKFDNPYRLPAVKTKGERKFSVNLNSSTGITTQRTMNMFDINLYDDSRLGKGLSKSKGMLRTLLEETSHIRSK